MSIVGSESLSRKNGGKEKFTLKRKNADQVITVRFINYEAIAAFETAAGSACQFACHPEEVGSFKNECSLEVHLTFHTGPLALPRV